MMNESDDDWKEFLLMLRVHEQKKAVDALVLGIKNCWIICARF
jgi:hypothetical protein